MQAGITNNVKKGRDRDTIPHYPAGRSTMNVITYMKMNEVFFISPVVIVMLFDYLNNLGVPIDFSNEYIKMNLKHEIIHRMSS